MANGGKSTFILALQGQITTAQFPEHDSIWIRYNFVAGPDWTFLSGDTEGISASCFRNSNQRFVFNLPFAATFRTTNAFRWPQLVITCFGRDFWGNEVVKGYGAVPMPTVLGRHRLEAACSAPEPSSAFQGFIGMVTGKTPELIDPNLLAGPDTREVLRMATEGLVSVEVDVMHKDMKRNGFDWDIGTLRTPSTAPLPVLETLSCSAGRQNQKTMEGGGYQASFMDRDQYAPPPKRFRPEPGVDPTNPDPSIVVHVRNLSSRATEADLLEALSSFGQIAYATVMPNKRMALVEFESIDAAKQCVNFAATKPINVAGVPALFNYSTSPMIQRLGLESERPNHILILTVYNAQYPITVEVIHEICAPNGDVKKIAIIRRTLLQVLVEFSDQETARRAKYAMNGADIYSGCCTLKVEFAKPDHVKVTRNDETQWDYTRPDLGAGDAGAPAPAYTRRPLIGGANGGPPAQSHRYEQVPQGAGAGRRDEYGGRDPGYADNYGRDPSQMTQSGYSGHSSGGGHTAHGDYGYGGRSAPPAHQERYDYGRSGHPDNAPRLSGGSPVIMIYGITHETMNCEKLFNILCQYGNVERIKFMKKKTDTAMVEMGQPAQVTSVLQFLQGMEMFGCNITIRPSKQTEVREQGAIFQLPDGSPSFRDYSNSRNQRYSTPELAFRNRVCAPTNTIHWFNAPVTMDVEKITELFRTAGGPLPAKVMVNQSRTEKSRAGTAEFHTIVEANEALALANHTPVATSISRMPFIVKMAYFAPGPKFYGAHANEHE
ncbi:unnamed protein product, partial [Mesorhabditis spiculigera]